MIMKKKEERLHTATLLKELFEANDTNGDGVLTLHEFTEGLKNEEIRVYFDALQIDASEGARLYDMLDANGDGQVFIDEFLTMCVKFQGVASSQELYHELGELHKLLLEVHKMHAHGSSVLAELH